MLKNYTLLIISLIFIIGISSCTVEHIVDPPYDIAEFQWEYTTPSQVGLKDSLIYAGLSDAAAAGEINSVLVIKNSKIAASAYYNGTGTSTVYDVKSVTKSYLSLFTGIAIDKGIITLDSKLTSFFPEIKNALPDQRINDITVRDLLTMTSGLKDDAVTFPTMPINNWLQFMLSFPLDHDPGTYYRYSDSGAYLLSALLTKAAGINTYQFARANYLDPLNISIQGWFYNPDGIPLGGSTMEFTAKNMAVLGLLYLNKGKLNGKQIVSESWVNQSVTDRMGWQNEEMGALKNLGYGYMWWTGEMNGHKVYSAIGYGGQMVFCSPDHNMVIAFCSNGNVDSGQATATTHKALDIIAKYFLPAAGY